MIIAAWESAGSGITIADALSAFLALRKGFAKQVRGLADSSRYVMLDQFTARDMIPAQGRHEDTALEFDASEPLVLPHRT